MGNLNFTGPYMPPGDKEFYDWLDNLAERIDADPHRYGLTEADATIIMNHWQSYARAYKLAKQPHTRTSSAIQQKDAVKASAMASLRIYAGLIRSNMGIDNQTLVELGLNPRNNSRSPVPAPQSAPLLMPICGYPGVTALRFADENTPASRRKPWGVLQIQVAAVVTEPGEPLPIKPEPVVTQRLFTKQPILFEHDVKDAGKLATYFGRWVTARGLVGPWSLPARFTICAGGSAIPKKMREQMRVPEVEAIEKKRRKAA